MKRLLVALAASAALYAAPATAADFVQVYNAPVGLVGNQDWAGTLGLNFTVNSATTITQLGVFDSGSNGLNATLTAAIFDSSHNLVATAQFLGGTGTSGGAYIFKAIGPVTLAAGNYQLASWGFNANDLNYNYGYIANGNGGPITFNTAGGRLTAVGTAFSGTAGVFADQADDGNTRYGSASLIAAVPEPATWAMMVVGFGMVGFGVRARRKQSARVTFA